MLRCDFPRGCACSCVDANGHCVPCMEYMRHYETQMRTWRTCLHTIKYGFCSPHTLASLCYQWQTLVYFLLCSAPVVLLSLAAGTSGQQMRAFELELDLRRIDSARRVKPCNIWVVVCTIHFVITSLFKSSAYD